MAQYFSEHNGHAPRARLVSPPFAAKRYFSVEVSGSVLAPRSNHPLGPTRTNQADHQLSIGFQFAGGKEICQKVSAGLSNSTGTRCPPWLSRGARVTRAVARSRVRSFTTTNTVSASKEREQRIIAP